MDKQRVPLYARAEDGLRGRRAPLFMALLAVMLGASALWVGWQWDDYVLRFSIDPPEQYLQQTPHPLLMFSFADGDPSRLKEIMDLGWLPWWTSEDFKMAFFRPLTALTHWIDFHFWPDHPSLMHLHSLLWLGLLVGAATLTYRGILGSGACAALAGLLFAIDDAHGVPAGWLANRNALVASLFGLLAVFFHDRWRKNGKKSFLVFSCVSLSLGLLGGEMAVAAGGYLLAYAFFMERGNWRSRLFSLLPSAGIGICWFVFYRGMGFGAKGSAWYIDPSTETGAYLKAIFERGPILLFGELGFLPSDLFTLLSDKGVFFFWLLAVFFLCLFSLFAVPVLRSDRTSRFFALGMILSILPVATTFPFDRLLVMAGFGGAGLMARILLDASALIKLRFLPVSADGQSRVFLSYGKWFSRGLKGMVCLLAFSHMVAAPLLMPLRALSPALLGNVLNKTFDELPLNAGLAERTLIFVNGPSAAVGGFLLPMFIMGQGKAAPDGTHVLAPSIHGIELTRVDPWTLAIIPDHGFLDTPDKDGAEGDLSCALLSPAYMLQRMDMARQAFRPGEQIDITAFAVEVKKTTPDGRPSIVHFRFQLPLEDESFGWFEWREGGYVPFVPPGVGETIRLPPPFGPNASED
ncbi:hypothetical protein [Desulfatiglans anilini]|uniref:hypothetical protein n=1 Tax=Desulfatiglans anilini TaxID=90728 RepID=UPI000480C1C5|nr:hypothetical protein [Desulfatiglans anilini]